MKLKILIVGMVLVAVCLSGCVGTDAATGTYRCTVDDGTLYLKSEGTYRMLIDEAHGGGGIHGTYGIEEGKVLLDSALNIVIPFVIDGRDLIDPGGDRWVRD